MSYRFWQRRHWYSARGMGERPTTSHDTLTEAAKQIETAVPDGNGLEEVVADKGYHSNQALVDLEAVGMRSYFSEPDRGRRNWKDNPEARDAVYRNRRRIRGARGKRLLRQRGGRLERPFAHLYETGRMRRVQLRGHDNTLKRVLLRVGALNLGLLIRTFVWRRHAVEPPGPRGCAASLCLVPHSAPRHALGCDPDPVPTFNIPRRPTRDSRESWA